MTSGIWNSSHGGREGTSARRRSWFERHASALARFAVSSGERNEVDELVQDTFVRAFNSTRRISRRQLLSDVVVHDRATSDCSTGGGPRNDGAIGPRFKKTTRPRSTTRSIRWSPTKRRSGCRAPLLRLSPTQREVFSLRVSRRIVVQGNRRGGGHDGRSRPGALSQRDARGEGVSR